MTPRHHIRWIGGALAALLVFCAVQALAQDPNAPRPTPDDIVDARQLDRTVSFAELTRDQDMTPAVVLARVCVKEASFNSPADCAAIRIVLTRVGRGNVVTGARAYSPKTFDPSRLRDRPWIAFLNGRGTEPRGWPANLSWRAHRVRWLALLENVETFIATDYRPCEPDHWGDRLSDHARAVSYNWQPVDCGRTLDEYWRVPSRRE